MATLLLNADGTPHKVLGIKEAISHLRREKSYVVEEGERIMTGNGEIVIPNVLQLKKYIKIRTRKPRCNRNIIFYRDKFICQYCGESFEKNIRELTLDHVVPKSKGGKHSVDNVVAACKPCNNRKDNNTPKEACMPLIGLIKPVRYYCLALYKVALLYPEWKKYLR